MRDESHDDDEQDRWIGDPASEAFEAALTAEDEPYDARLPHVMTLLGPIPPAALGLTIVTQRWPAADQAPATVLAALEAAYALGLRAIWVSNEPSCTEAEDLRWLAARAPVHLMAGAPAGQAWGLLPAGGGNAPEPVAVGADAAGSHPRALPIAGAETFGVRAADGTYRVAVGDQLARLAATASRVAAAWAAGDSRWLAGFTEDPVTLLERLPLALMGADLPAVAVRQILVENPMAALTIVPADPAHS